MTTLNLRKALFALLAAAPLAACSASSTSTPAAAAPSAAKPNPAKSGPVIARYGDQTLTAGELQAKLNERSPFERARMNSLDRKKEFVEQLVRFDLLAAEAKSRGLDQDPEVVRAMQTVMVRKLIQSEIDENPEKKKFADEELKAYYDQHQEDFVRPEMVRLSAIILNAKDQAEAQKRKKEADEIVKALKAKPNDFSAFGQAVAAKSEDAATKAVQGDLHFLSKDQLTQRYGDAVASAAFSLTQGGVSEPIVTPKGVYVFKLMGKTPAVNQPFDQAKAMLGQRLWYEKRNKLFDGFMDELKKKSNYSLDEAELEKLQVSTTAPTTNLTSLNTAEGMPPAPGQGATHPPQIPSMPAKQVIPVKPGAPKPAGAK